MMTSSLNIDVLLLGLIGLFYFSLCSPKYAEYFDSQIDTFSSTCN